MQARKIDKQRTRTSVSAKSDLRTTLLVSLKWLVWIGALAMIAGHTSKGWALDIIGPVDGRLKAYVHGRLDVGTQFEYRGLKGNYTLSLTEKGKSTFTFKNSMGCQFVYNGVPFADAVRRKCGDKKWRERQVKARGRLPGKLKEGRTYAFNMSGTNSSGKAYTVTRECEVKQAVRVKVIAGEFDTYPVRCQQNNNRYTFYASPSLGTWVAFVFRQGKSKAVVRELVKVSN